MKKKEIKKTKLKLRSKIEVKRDQYTVVLEDVRRQFGVMREGFSGVNKRFDRLDKKVDDNHKEFLEFKGVMIGFKSEMTDFKSEMTDFKNETNSNFKSIFEYLSKIDDKLQLMKIEIADLKIIFKDRVELKRVIKMERQMVVMQEQIDTLMTQR